MIAKDTSPLQTLSEIKQLMERSSRFMSLSGLSGVFAGVYALLGAYAAYAFLNMHDVGFFSGEAFVQRANNKEVLLFIFIDAFLIVTLAVGTGIFLTTRKAKQDGNSIFDSTAIKLIVNLCIPLFTGGIFCLALIYHAKLIFVPSAMLIFYGLSLINASHYTRSDIRSLGFAEVILGILASFFLGYGFLFWALGFGVLHIVYGTYMYFKYER